MPGRFSFLGGSGLFLTEGASEEQQDLGWALLTKMIEQVSTYALVARSPPPLEVCSMRVRTCKRCASAEINMNGRKRQEVFAQCMEIVLSVGYCAAAFVHWLARKDRENKRWSKSSSHVPQNEPLAVLSFIAHMQLPLQSIFRVPHHDKKKCHF